MADVLRECLQRTGWRIVNQTPLPVVWFSRDGLDAPRLVAALQQRQIAWMSAVEFDGTSALRACITSFRTTEQDIERVVREMNRLLVAARQAYAQRNYRYSRWL